MISIKYWQKVKREKVFSSDGSRRKVGLSLTTGIMYTLINQCCFIDVKHKKTILLSPLPPPSPVKKKIELFNSAISLIYFQFFFFSAFIDLINYYVKFDVCRNDLD